MEYTLLRASCLVKLLKIVCMIWVVVLFGDSTVLGLLGKRVCFWKSISACGVMWFVAPESIIQSIWVEWLVCVVVVRAVGYSWARFTLE